MRNKKKNAACQEKNKYDTEFSLSKPRNERRAVSVLTSNAEYWELFCYIEIPK